MATPTHPIKRQNLLERDETKDGNTDRGGHETGECGLAAGTGDGHVGGGCARGEVGDGADGAGGLGGHGGRAVAGGAGGLCWDLLQVLVTCVFQGK